MAGRLIPVLGSVLAALALIVGSTPRTDSAIEYVALGDSRAAAPDRGVGGGFDGCGRSGNGYPVQVANALRPRAFIDVTCSGATSANVVDSAQVTTAANGRRREAAPQVEALRATTTLVTISIGGNDLRWWGLVAACFPPEQTVDAGCRFDRGAQERIDRKLTELDGLVAADLDAVVARAPKATVVVVGHGGIYGSSGCGDAATVSTPDAAWVSNFFRGVDDVLRAQALAHHALFVDVRDAAAGHESCAPVDRRWFAGNTAVGSTPERHPTPAGSRAIAELVLDALGCARASCDRLASTSK
ncbi:SGNH/GDSL hydrolase family protein [Nocardia arizonensis]|uniref:SGNH/GDSL hydrolase family protein n=1 Tax=Nocardia arizonensis TaxID=1141647 RepID=UPI00138F05CD|nr:SGNH/GDSL hydrolase family protein [Nocardia arizonensis]